NSDGGPRHGPPYPPGSFGAPRHGPRSPPGWLGAPRYGPRYAPGWLGAPRENRGAPRFRRHSPLLENCLELELAADRGVRLHGLEARHGVVVDVTVLVEAPLAVDALEVLGGRDGLAQRLALVLHVLGLLDGRGRALEGVDDDAGALEGVQRVRRGLLVELGFVGLIGLGADAAHLFERQPGERDPHVGGEGGIAGGALEQLFLEQAVGAQEARARRGEADFLHLPDDHLGTRLDDAAEVDEVGAGGADLGQHRLLVGLLPVDALVGDDGEPDLLGRRLEDVGDALAVELLVVEDVDLLGAQPLGPLGADGALDVVWRDRAEVVGEAGRPVDLRLARGGPALLGEAGIGVGRRHLGHVGAVGDGNGDLRGARGVGADVDD